MLGDFGLVTAEKHPKDSDFLDKYAAERWDVSLLFRFLVLESILHFMVGSDSAEIGTCVRDVLLLSGLMKRYCNADIFTIVEEIPIYRWGLHRKDSNFYL